MQAASASRRSGAVAHHLPFLWPAPGGSSAWIFLKSATSVKSAATRRISASRLARTAGSSAMTMTPSKKASTAGLSVATARRMAG